MIPEFEDFPLQYATDATILLHREIHFGGSFPIMLDYYRKEGKGVSPDCDMHRILALAELETQIGQNVAPLILTGADAEKIRHAKEAYQELKDLYQNRSLGNQYPILLADLILSEEVYPEKEIAAIVKEKGAIVPALLQLLRSETFYDPLYPGYGQAPLLAAKCLGLIGDKRAIYSLFEAIGEGDFFDEDILLKALASIGEPAKNFLLHVVKGKPLNVDNEKAAIALAAFKGDPKITEEIVEVCLDLLCQEEIRKQIPFANYLVYVCEGLKEISEEKGGKMRKTFLSLADDKATPRDIARDIREIAKGWQEFRTGKPCL